MGFSAKEHLDENLKTETCIKIEVLINKHLHNFWSGISKTWQDLKIFYINLHLSKFVHIYFY